MNIEDLQKISSFTTRDNKIYINIGALASFYVTMPRQASMYIKEKDKIINMMIGDEKLFEAFLSLLENKIEKYDVYIYDSYDILYKHNIDISDIISDLALRSTNKNKKKLRKINQIKSGKAYRRKLCDKKLIFGKTYLDVIKDLCKIPEEFEALLDSFEDDVYGRKLKKIFGYIELESLAKEICNENEFNNFKTNSNFIKEEFNDPRVEDFVPYRGNVDKFTLDPSILEEIKKGMPENLNDIQKAYYGYRRICELFTFSEKYFIAQSDKAIDDINRLNNIKIGDSLVCSELTMIFAKYLDSLNIPFMISNNNNQREINYKTHLKLLFLAEDAVVDADIANTAVNSDISISKFYNFTQFFKVYSDKKRTIARFNKNIKEVDKLFKERYNDEKQKRNKELLKALRTTRKDDLTIQDKIDLLLVFVKSFEYNSLDLFSVINAVAYNLFDDDDSYYDIEFIINNAPYDGDEAEVVLCVTTNKNGVEKDTLNNEYYIFNKGVLKEKLNIDKIKEKFENGEFEYTSNKRDIPGIDNPQSIKKR